MVRSRQPAGKKNITPEALMKWIVCSLYMDEAVPGGNLLQWYYQVLTGVKLSVSQLTSLVRTTPGIYLEPPSSKKLSFKAVLEEPPLGFTGFLLQKEQTFAEDIISAEAWDQARYFTAHGGWPKTDDPAFKIATVAAWLQDRSDLMNSISFGRLLQVVNLLLLQKHLGKRDGLIVPFVQSEEFERLCNAEAGKPTGVKSNEAYIKDWDELRSCLRLLIRLSSDEDIEVSQVKLMCRSRLHKELSETVFGHTNFLKLLDDPCLGPDFVITGDPSRTSKTASSLRISLAKPSHTSENDTKPNEILGASTSVHQQKGAIISLAEATAPPENIIPCQDTNRPNTPRIRSFP
eukprot:TRINITY_DN21428_c1_g1_i1.p1 TRINITY_DN21428_c1_g1~~TRINITY_DN21428_c1_g1_i1.p1  ORF type:complete len:361 (+),score=75.45 TRINITY_DN21428_c1_g1_i1:45-1085(+)